MGAVITDRIDGLSSGTAVKSPCRAATTANIALSGLQTIDGIALAECDRVFVKDQADQQKTEYRLPAPLSGGVHGILIVPEILLMGRWLQWYLALLTQALYGVSVLQTLL